MEGNVNDADCSSRGVTFLSLPADKMQNRKDDLPEAIKDCLVYNNMFVVLHIYIVFHI